MLRKSPILVVMLLLFTYQGCAQNERYVSLDGKFTIDLRSTPTEDRNSPEAKVGGKKLWWREGRASFSVGYSDSPNAKKGLGDAAVEASADGYLRATPKSAELVSRKKIEMDGYPGVEVKTREPDGYTALTRYFMVDTRLYCVMALWTAGSDDSDVIRKLDSFKVNVITPTK